MGAGRQRWWRDYELECAAWTGTEPAEHWRLTEARTESGIVVKVRLYVTVPIAYGTFRID